MGRSSALNDVTPVPPGITGLLGPNGAGKSTFMKIAMRPAQTESGTITVLRRADLVKSYLTPDRILRNRMRSMNATARVGLRWCASTARRRGATDRLAKRALGSSN